jgi:hypothetical protein
MRTQFREQGLDTDYVFAAESDWAQIKTMMEELKTKSKGENRIYYMVGTEDYYRKVVCATILSEATAGITWLSKGTWIDEWWTKSDKLSGNHRKWLLEDTGGKALKDMTTEFKLSWDAFGATDDARSKALLPLYRTDQLELLDVPAGANMSKLYHITHVKWHPTFRKKLYDRGYYDIFVFDLRANLIYSVYKESDYATNFDISGTGQWKDSGLGDAFRAAVAAPDNISYIDWKPYGPSAGALAAFLSIGVKDDDDENPQLIGVYTIQLPPDYVRSIEEVEPACSFAAIGDSLEGAINVAGIGKPTEENMVKPLPCFDGHSPSSFLSLIDKHLEGGYPLGDRGTQVSDQYGLVKAHAADAVCVIAFTVKHLLAQGYSIQDIQKPDQILYEAFLDYVKTKVDFMGASGHVKFEGNDKANYLIVQQVQQGVNVDIGMVDPAETEVDDKITWKHGGPNAYMWKKEKTDPIPADTFPYWVFQVFAPLLICCAPLIIGSCKGWKNGAEEMARAQ